MIRNWRPTTLDDFVGQDAFRREVKNEIIVAKARHTRLTNRVLSGPAGTGKTSVCNLIARECDRHVETIVGSEATFKSLGLSIFTAALTTMKGYWQAEDFDGRLSPEDKAKIGTIKHPHLVRSPIIFIDEADGMDRELLQLLHPILEGPRSDGRPHTLRIPLGANDSTTCWIPDMTFYFATNYLGELYKKDIALRSRFANPNEFTLYKPEELAKIIKHYASFNEIRIDDDATLAIATRSRGVPRAATQFFSECATHYEAAKLQGSDAGSIDIDLVTEFFEIKQIDSHGLTRVDHDYLFALRATHEKSKKSLATVADLLNSDLRTVENVIEPYLLSLGFAEKGAGGRFITDRGRAAIGLEVKNPMGAFGTF